MNSSCNFPLQNAPRELNGRYSSEYGGRKIRVCKYFPAMFCKTFFSGTPRCLWGVFSGIIFLLPGQRTFVFMSPVAFYRFFQSIIVLIFTLNTAAVCVNEWLFCVYSIACSLKALSYDIIGVGIHGGITMKEAVIL